MLSKLLILFFLFSFSFFFFFFFLSFRAAPVAYGGSQARGPNGAVAAGLSRSHSNSGSKPCLRPTAQLTATPDLNPLIEARDQAHVLMDAGGVH